jgi:hypothetical protein
LSALQELSITHKRGQEGYFQSRWPPQNLPTSRTSKGNGPWYTPHPALTRSHPTKPTPQNKTLSDPFDPVLALQGIGWLTRKAIGAATVTLHVKHYALEDGTVKIDIDQVLSGGLKGSVEERTLDWQWRGHTDYLFGTVKGHNRYNTLAAVLEEAKGKGVTEEDAQFLAEGWLKETEEGEVMESFVENEGNQWTAWQIWGFAEVGGERRYVRRIVVRKTAGKEEVRRVRLVYDFAGELV